MWITQGVCCTLSVVCCLNEKREACFASRGVVSDYRQLTTCNRHCYSFTQKTFCLPSVEIAKDRIFSLQGAGVLNERRRFCRASPLMANLTVPGQTDFQVSVSPEDCFQAWLMESSFSVPDAAEEIVEISSLS